MSIQADLRHVIYALADALDMVGIDGLGHGRRVGIMAAECGRAKGAAEPAVALLFDLGMLHDVGVSSTQVRRQLVDEFDWEGAQAHCEMGSRLLGGFGPLAPLAVPVQYHHTHWDQLVRMDVDPRHAWQANLIFLVDRVDTLMMPHYGDGSVLMYAPQVRERIRAGGGTYFAPELVELFLDASVSEAFWLLLEPRAIESYLQDLLAQGQPYRASFMELRGLASIFSRIVDAKSPFTAEHSQGVANVARLLAGRMGLGEENCDKVEIAGLLHDVGKLRVPDEILDKPSSLDSSERTAINAHSFESYQILRRIRGFEEIALWAAYHHEEPGGTGYPFHLKAEALPLEARIMRVADIFQAMAQDRPYRRGLPAGEVLAFLDRLARDGRLDAEILSVAAASLDEVMAAARPCRAA